MLRGACQSNYVGRTQLRELFESLRNQVAKERYWEASEYWDQAVPSKNWLHSTSGDSLEARHGASPGVHTEQCPTKSQTTPNGSIKTKLLQEAMKHVPKYGWSDATLQVAASELGLSFAVLGALPRGPGHLIDYFHSLCNDELEKQFLCESGGSSSDSESWTTMERLEYGARARLEMVLPYIGRLPLLTVNCSVYSKYTHHINICLLIKRVYHPLFCETSTDSWPEAMAIQARPSEVAYAAQNYWSIADIIYRQSGSMSSDLTWYAKHAAIMAAYCSTELYMVQDCSPGYFDTWSFLKRRLNDGRTLWA